MKSWKFSRFYSDFLIIYISNPVNDSSILISVTSCLEWDEFSPEMETLLFFPSDVVKLLLEYGAFVNQTDKAHYKTGLHVACEAQSVACVQYLLDAGADPNVQAEEGRTPLHIGGHKCCHMIIGTRGNHDCDGHGYCLQLMNS